MIKLKNIGLFTALGLGLTACGGNGDRVSNTGATTSSSTAVEANLLGADISALNSQYIEIEASATSGASFTWSQVSGPAVTFLDDESNTAKLLTPAEVAIGERVTLRVERTEGSLVATDTIDIILSPCNAGADDIFVDCVAPGFGALRSYEQLHDESGFQESVNYSTDDGNHINWYLVETGETGHDTVIEIHFGANDPNNEVNANGWFGIGAPNNGNSDLVANMDLSQYANGSISFDYRHIDGAGTVVELGMECGYPCTSERKTMLTDFDWQTMTVSIAALAEAGADLTRLNVPFMFLSQWGSQRWNIFQIDNIRLSQTYIPPAIDEQARPAGPLFLDLLDESQNIEVGAGTYGVTLTQSPDGYTMDYSADGGFTWFFSQFMDGDRADFRDLSEFYHGELVIRYTVNSWGSDTEGSFVINSECGAACGLYPSYEMPFVEANVPTVLRIPVADLVARGLDLSKVFRIFQFRLRDNTTEGISMTLHEAYLELPAQ